MQLPSAVMGKEDRAYYGLMEFRAAIQNYAPNLSGRGVVDSYMIALDICLKPGKEGYSHEMLFAAHLYAKMRQLRKAAVFFAETGAQFQKERQHALARQSYQLGAQYFERTGNARVALKLRGAAAALS